MVPFKHMSMFMKSKKQQQKFEKMMEGELTRVAQTEDCLAGVKLLVETMKKYYVTNFAMQ